MKGGGGKGGANHGMVRIRPSVTSPPDAYRPADSGGVEGTCGYVTGSCQQAWSTAADARGRADAEGMLGDVGGRGGGDLTGVVTDGAADGGGDAEVVGVPLGVPEVGAAGVKIF